MGERITSEPYLSTEPRFRASFRDHQKEILGQFSPDQQKNIQHKVRILSSLAYFIGKDFKMPVELNEPGQGWHWDFKENKTRVDPQDLLEKPMDYLRCVISHEGGHRRISRAEVVPVEEWKEPGFAFLTGMIEDPRTNNFVAEAYPKFKEQMQVAYSLDADIEAQAKAQGKDKLGHIPKFVQGGFEYIKLWFKESQSQEMTLSDDLPEDVKAVVEATLASARDSWWTYPSKKEADQGEETIKKYAEASYRINRDKVWPEFKKLVESDMENQEMQEALQDMQQGQGEKGEGHPGQDLPQPLKDQLTEGEQKELQQAIEQALGASQQGTDSGQEQEAQETKPNGKPGVVDLDKLSPELKQKIAKYIDSLPQEVKEELARRAEKALKELEDEIKAELHGKLSDDPDKKAQRDAAMVKTGRPTDVEEDTPSDSKPPEESADQKEFRDLLEQTLKKDENVYETYRREVLPIIDSLENDLREIFVARRAQGWQSGFRTGKKIDIKKRIQEKVKGVTAVDSRAWERRDLPQEKDYAISLLVDLSGSMSGDGKIQETFKGAIVLAEALNRLSIETEILGFNDRIYEYQPFGQPMSREVREKMGGMLREVDDTSGTGRARYNDDGWALEQASLRLAKQKAAERFLFVLSDGKPEESPMHPRSEFDLSKVIAKVMRETDQKLIGLGIGSGTGHVDSFYPNSMANIGVKDMADRLADVIREVIVNYDTF